MQSRRANRSIDRPPLASQVCGQGEPSAAVTVQPDTKGSFQMSDDIVIVSAVRTPVGAFNGAFAALSAHELGKVAITETLKRAGVEGAQVSEVILGQILTAGQGQNPARQASIAAGIPVESPAWGVNQ